jgi:hypothetical protein
MCLKTNQAFLSNVAQGETCHARCAQVADCVVVTVRRPAAGATSNFGPESKGQRGGRGAKPLSPIRHMEKIKATLHQCSREWAAEVSH